MRVYVLSKKALVVLLRWLLFFVSAYLIAADDWRGFRLFIAALALFAVSNVALSLLSAETFRRWRLGFAIVLFDIAFISTAIYLTGDLNLYIFYFFTILMASYGRQIQGSLLAAAFASGFYLWLVVERGSPQDLLSPAVLIRLPFFYLVALMSSFMAEESREEGERLVWTRAILDMTQELGLAHERRKILDILRTTLKRLPGVVDARGFFQTGERFIVGEALDASSDQVRFLSREELGIPAPAASGGRAGATGFVTVSLPRIRAREVPHPLGAKSLAAFPFALRSGQEGLLVVYGARRGGFEVGVCEVFEIAALSLARSLESQEAFGEINRRVTEIGALMEVNQIINSSLDLRDVLRKVMAQSTRMLSAEAASLMLLDEATHELVFEVATGEKGNEIKQIRLKPGEGVAGWVAQKGQPLVVNDPEGDARFFKNADRQTGFTTRNILAVPLRVRKGVIGVLEVLNKLPPGPFGDEDLRLLEAVADQAGFAVEKARLYRYMEEQVNETIQMYLSLEREKSKIETILASMFEGVLVADESGAVTLVTHSARRALSPDGTSWVPEYDRIAGLLGKAVRERVEACETIAPDLPGRRTYRVRTAPMQTAAGKLLGAVAVLEDVTELTRLSELKSEFISQVSHELRTPLTSVRAAVNLLLRGRAGPIAAEQQELAALIQGEATRMAGLINDLLDLSKIEAGMMRLETVDVVVPPLVERLVAGMAVLIGEKGIRVAWEFDPALGPARADAKRLERIFANLIGNAVKYSPRGSTVTIGGGPGEAGEGAPGLRFWVRDNGPGVAEEDRTRIFGRFERGGGRGVAGVQGTGLGLAIARGIVEEHGGTIWVQSRVGEGSTFFFTLPSAGQEQSRERVT